MNWNLRVAVTLKAHKNEQRSRPSPPRDHPIMRTVHSHFDLPLNTEGGLLVFKLTGKGGVFLPAVQVEVSGESEGMVIVIADRAVGGRPHPSTLLRCGSPAPCGSGRRRICWPVSEDADEPAAILPEMRWAFDDLAT